MEQQQPTATLSPEADGFVPPWAEWDFNEWETCTDTDLLVVCRHQSCMLLWNVLGSKLFYTPVFVCAVCIATRLFI